MKRSRNCSENIQNIGLGLKPEADATTEGTGRADQYQITSWCLIDADPLIKYIADIQNRLPAANGILEKRNALPDKDAQRIILEIIVVGMRIHWRHGRTIGPSVNSRDIGPGTIKISVE